MIARRPIEGPTVDANGFEVTRLKTGRVEVTVDGERVEARPGFWRAVLFDCAAREKLRAIVSRDLAKPIESAVWWNGDGR